MHECYTSKKTKRKKSTQFSIFTQQKQEVFTICTKLSKVSQTIKRHKQLQSRKYHLVQSITNDKNDQYYQRCIKIVHGNHNHSLDRSMKQYTFTKTKQTRTHTCIQPVHTVTQSPSVAHAIDTQPESIMLKKKSFFILHQYCYTFSIKKSSVYQVFFIVKQ